MDQKPRIADYILVLIQLLLFVLYFYLPPFVEQGLDSLFRVIGAIPMITGAVILVWGMIQLLPFISIFPTPKPGGELVTRGIYKYVRHPIYSGIILLALGYGIFSRDFDKLVIALMILLLFEIKSGYEERKLFRAYPEYDEYRLRTGKFIPLFLLKSRKEELREEEVSSNDNDPSA